MAVHRRLPAASDPLHRAISSRERVWSGAAWGSRGEAAGSGAGGSGAGSRDAGGGGGSTPPRSSR